MSNKSLSSTGSVSPFTSAEYCPDDTDYSVVTNKRKYYHWDEEMSCDVMTVLCPPTLDSFGNLVSL